MITLLDAGGTNLGGFNNFTAHLALCFEAKHHLVRIWRPATRTENKQRPYVESMTYRNVNATAAWTALQAGQPVLITAGSATLARDPQWLRVLQSGAHLVIHDPNDLKTLLPVLRPGQPVVCGRRAMMGLARSLGYSATHIPYPYVPGPKVRRKPVTFAGCWARLDWDKHTDVLVGANLCFKRTKATACGIALYGAENRLYTHMRLDPIDTDWRRCYRGAFPRERSAGVRIAATLDWALDLSAIPGEGGGSQYTFKEAWDAGTPLIVSQDWILPNDELIPGQNCLATAPTVPDLLTTLEQAETLRAELTPKLVAGGRASLAAHGPDAIVPAYLDFLGVT